MWIFKLGLPTDIQPHSIGTFAALGVGDLYPDHVLRVNKLRHTQTSNPPPTSFIHTIHTAHCGVPTSNNQQINQSIRQSIQAPTPRLPVIPPLPYPAIPLCPLRNPHIYPGDTSPNMAPPTSPSHPQSQSHSRPGHPRRGFVRINVDSNADHIYQRVEDHNRHPEEDEDRDSPRERSGVRVREHEHSGPSSGSTRLNILTRPFEKEVVRSFERIVDGRVVRDTVRHFSEGDDRRDSRKEERRRKIEDRFDCSEL